MKDFRPVFAALRRIMLDAAPEQMVSRDDPGDLTLRTAHVDAKTGQPSWFGTVTIKKSYVAYHLMPLYTDADLVAAIPPRLAKRKQGKTCFNFTAVDPDLFDDLRQLTETANASAR